MEHGKERMEEECKTPFPKGRRRMRSRPPCNPVLQLDRTCSQANDTPSPVCGSSYSVNEHFPPPSSSSSHESSWELTEEEHVVVTSLLLLSNYDELPHNVTLVNETPPVQLVESKHKLLSSKFIGPDGNVYYRCNICGREFRSFQALGGHRASHKKSRLSQLKNESCSKNSMNEAKIEQSNKTNIVEIKKLKEVGEEEKDEDDMLKLSMNSSFSMDIAKARSHQCTICGSEFISGQALGGHMRRHRNPAMALDATSSDVVGQDFDIKEEEDDILKETRSSPLALDLNLPAPSEEKGETTPEANFLI